MGAKVWKRTEKGGSQSYVVGIQTTYKDNHRTYSHLKRYPYPHLHPQPHSYQYLRQDDGSKATQPNHSSSGSNTMNVEPKDKVEEETQQNIADNKTQNKNDATNGLQMEEMEQQTWKNLFNQSNNYLSNQHDQMMGVSTIQDIQYKVSQGANCDQNGEMKSSEGNVNFKQGVRSHRSNFKSRRYNNNYHYFNQTSSNKQSLLNQTGDAQDQINSKQEFLKQLKMQQQKYEGAKEEVFQLKLQVKQLEETILLQKKRKAQKELNEHEERKQRLRTKLQRSFAKQFEQAAEVGQVKREAEERERQRQEVWALIERISSAKDPYEILGVDKNVVQDMDVQVRSQFKKLAVVLHPDKCSFSEATEAFRKVRNAYSSLQSKLVQ